jgi:hypothetical protein
MSIELSDIKIQYVVMIFQSSLQTNLGITGTISMIDRWSRVRYDDSASVTESSDFRRKSREP